MSGIAMKFKTGPQTFKAEAAVTGGQVVQAGTADGTIVPAGAASTTVLGVALTDAKPYTPPAPGVLTATPEHTAVACAPAVVPVTSDGTAAFGDLVVAAAAGTVTKVGATPAPGSIVGRVVSVVDADTVLVRLGS